MADRRMPATSIVAMKILYIVPVIHTSADLGTLAPSINSTSRDRLGEEFWLKHKKTVVNFWDSVADFLGSLGAAGFKLYQDGLIADGEIGMRIVEQGVRDGSKNYQIIAQLLKKGAQLVSTEDLALVKREYELISNIVKANSAEQRISAAVEFKLAAKELLCKRDTFIAQRIAQTLGEGETGLLFIGAYHDVIPRLPHDITVYEVKETVKVREYHILLTDSRRKKRRLEQLAEYLVAPVTQD